MKIKHAMRYQLYDMVRSTTVFYLVVLCVFAVLMILTRVLVGSVHIGSMESSANVFLFVLGLNMFKAPFQTMLQNGISRRTQVAAYGLSALLLSVGVGLITTLLSVVFSGVHYVSLFAQLYGNQGFFVPLLWNIACSFVLLVLGYCISTLYYRMNKAAKILVSIGVPVVLFIGLPMLEVFVPDFHLFTSLLKAVSWCLGAGFGGVTAPMRPVGLFTLAALALLGISRLLTMRATLKAG